MRKSHVYFGQIQRVYSQKFSRSKVFVVHVQNIKFSEFIFVIEALCPKVNAIFFPFHDLLYILYSVNWPVFDLKLQDGAFSWSSCNKIQWILNANPTKWSNTLKQFVGKLPTNCLSVFDHFLGLVLKGLIQHLKLWKLPVHHC